MAVSSALIWEENRIQLPVYYTSWVFCGAEGRYPPMEKLAFTLITVACKLKPCFQVNTILVQTDKPLRRAMNNLEPTGRLVLWVIELNEFNIQYWTRTAIKAHALANLIAEFITKKDEEEEPMIWMIWTDGLSNQQAGGARVLLQSLEKDTIKCAVRLQFPTTNNEAEYEAIAWALTWLK